jgi:hypothetical protein
VFLGRKLRKYPDVGCSSNPCQLATRSIHRTSPAITLFGHEPIIYDKKNASFEENEHLKKLCNPPYNLQVKMVEKLNDLAL